MDLPPCFRRVICKTWSFAIWAAFVFSYPSDLLNTAFNDTSKVLSFVTAITFFLAAKAKQTDDVSSHLPKTE